MNETPYGWWCILQIDGALSVQHSFGFDRYVSSEYLFHYGLSRGRQGRVRGLYIYFFGDACRVGAV